MSGFLQRKRFNTILENTSYIGPTFSVIGSGTARPIVTLYASPLGNYYFYNTTGSLGAFTTGFTTSIQNLENFYKLTNNLMPDFSLMYGSRFIDSTQTNLGSAVAMAEDANGFYLCSSQTFLSNGFFIKIKPDTRVDTSFVQNASYFNSVNYFSTYPSAICLQSNGKILLGGSFTNYKTVGHNCLIRLNIDGTPDVSFNSNVAVSLSGGITNVSSISVQNDGKILVACFFSSTFRLKRLNSDGTEDSAFSTLAAGVINTTSSSINTIYVTSNGQILIGGNSLRHITHGLCYVLRLNSDGSEDTNFTNTVVRPSGVIAFNGGIGSILEISNKLFLAGNFTQWTSTPSNGGLSYLISFNDDLTLNSTFNDFAVRNGTTPYFIVNQSTGSTPKVNVSLKLDGNIVVCGVFVNYKSIKFLNHCVFLNPVTGSLDIKSSKSVCNYGKRVRKFSSIIRDIKYSNVDGTYIVAGSFSGYGELKSSDPDNFLDNSNINNIIKLNSNGTINNTFNSNNLLNGVSRYNAAVSNVVIQNDSKIILTGSFSNVNYSDFSPNNINNINYLLRLNNDGTPDQSFILNSSVIFSGGVYVSRFSASVGKTIVLSNGKILITGGFTNYNGSAGGTVTGLNRFIRLNSDGTEDRVYNDVATRNGTTPKFSSTINAVCELSSGQVLVGGAFTNYGGTTGYSRLIILSSSGSIGASELSFINNAIVSGTSAKFFTGSVTSIFQQSDGKILIGGSFANYVSTGNTRLIRLNSDGTLDTAFSNNLKVGTAAKLTLGQIDNITVEPDGKILIGGTFDYASNGASVSHRRFIRLNSDGTLDESFSDEVQTGTLTTTFTAVNTWVKTSDEKYLVGGNFTGYKNDTNSFSNYDSFDNFVIFNNNGKIDLK